MNVRAKLVASWLVCFPLSAAQADPGLYTIALHADVPAGEKPTLAVTAVEALRGVNLLLTRKSDKKEFTAHHDALAAGQVATLPIGDGAPGHADWQATLVILLTNGTALRQPLTLQTNGAATLHIQFSRDRLDVAARHLGFALSAPAKAAELTVTSDDGAVVKASASYHGEPAGTWLSIDWPPFAAASATANVLSLELRATAQNGATSLLKLTPWLVDVAHTDVHFATKSAAIDPAEESKLDDSRRSIVETVNKVHRSDASLAVHLYVVGHTDTVGSSADNQRLSDARARAIAHWFTQHAVGLPVEFIGVGESALAVATPDETDEPRNRRVDYILGVQPPAGIAGAWKK